MKINPYNSIQNNAYPKQVKQETKQEAIRGNKQDELQISSAAQQMQQGSKIETERQQKVAEIKDQVEAGTYKVDAQAVARKMYEFWSR